MMFDKLPRHPVTGHDDAVIRLNAMLSELDADIDNLCMMRSALRYAVESLVCAGVEGGDGMDMDDGK